MRRWNIEMAMLSFVVGLFLAGCGDQHRDTNAGAPPPLKVEQAEHANVFQADHPDKFPLTVAVEHAATSQLRATATVNPDVSRTVPVVSLASGRVVEIKARLGDTVQKGQVLLRVQSADISAAFSDYQKAITDEQLTRTQLERGQLLWSPNAGLSRWGQKFLPRYRRRKLFPTPARRDPVRVVGTAQLLNGKGSSGVLFVIFLM